MKTCFFITPIGKPGSYDRKRSDTIFHFLLEKICEKHKIKVIRADKINEPTSLINNIIGKIISADIVICDLSGNNPNVFYEMAIRHFTGKPIIHIAQIDKPLPFDINDFYTLFIDHSDGSSLKDAEERLEEMIKRSVDTKDAETSNPIIVFTKLNNLSITFSPLQSKTEDSSTPKKSIWTGKWISNFGDVDIVENEDSFSGKYQYYSKSYIGELNGRILDGFIVFKWNWIDSPKNGVGYWDIRNRGSNGEFKGGWYGVRSYSYEGLIEAITQDKVNKTDKDHYPWILYGKVSEYLQSGGSA